MVCKKTISLNRSGSIAGAICVADGMFLLQKIETI